MHFISDDSGASMSGVSVWVSYYAFRPDISYAIRDG